MSKHVIIPASSPAVHVEFEVPVSNGKPIEFAVPRLDYISNFDTQAIDWATKRVNRTDDDGNLVLGEDGKPQPDPDKAAIDDREVILSHLRIAGVTQKIITRLEKLTNGELNQIYEIWTKASRVSVGESLASDD